MYFNIESICSLEEWMMTVEGSGMVKWQRMNVVIVEFCITSISQLCQYLKPKGK